MSNNAPDYENNLAFDPKSADDLNEQKRDSEVLVAALEKCEKLEKQLKIAVETITALAIVGKYSIAIEALHQIKELDK